MSNDGISIGGAAAGVGAFGLAGAALQHPVVRLSSDACENDPEYVKAANDLGYKKYTNAKKINKMNVGDTFNGKVITTEVKGEAETIVKAANKKMLKGGLIGAGIALFVISLAKIFPINKNKDPQKAYVKDMSFGENINDTKVKAKLTEEDLNGLYIPATAPAVALQLAKQGKISDEDAMAFATPILATTQGQAKVLELAKRIKDQQ